MSRNGSTIPGEYGTYIARALATDGGHLSIGRGGFVLHFGWGARLSGYDCETIKAACIAAGLPVIDSRMVDIDAVMRLVIRGPMVAVGEEPSAPSPDQVRSSLWTALSYAPLAVVAAAYRDAGAEVWNLDLTEPAAIETLRR